MRKSIIKVLVAVLTLSLLLGAIVGITAMAADEGEVYLKSADIERNVKYDSKTYLLYRIAQTAIAEDDKAGLSLEIADAEGNFVGKVTPKVDGDYYVFVTQGVPAKELNTEEVVTVKSGSKAISPAITWSVEEYLYARLYADGYADVAEGGKATYGVDDGKDYQRRNLYYDLLKVGVNAQQVLAPDAEDKIGDSAFVFASDALATYGKFDEPTKITLRYDESKTPAGQVFVGWEYAMYDSFGELVKEGYAADASVITAEGYVKAKPYYVDVSTIDFNDIETAPENIGTTIDATKATKSITDGKFVVNQHTKDTNSHWYVAPNTKLDGANTVVFEADFSMNITNGATDAGYFYLGSSFGASGGTGIYWAHLRVSNGYLTFDKEYVRPSSGNVDESVWVVSPIKTDGTVSKLRVIFREMPWGEDYLEFYADGKLFHTTSNFCYKTYNDNQTPPKATAVATVGMNFAYAPIGIFTLDNVSMTQCILPEFEKLGADNTVVDFEASSAKVSRITAETENKYYTDAIDPKTGNGYILLTKNEAAGQSIDVPLTYQEEGANLAVLSFDYYMESTVTKFDNQIYANHKNTSGFGNATTPILVSMATSGLNSHKGKWIHVELTYKVLAVDENGSVTKVSTVATVTNGPSAWVYEDAETGVYKNGSSQFKLFNSAKTMEVPKADEITGFRITLNDAARGDVRFDNLSFKLINKASD